MRRFYIAFIFMVISGQSFCQKKCEDIMPMKPTYEFFRVQSGNNRITYCFHNHDTVACSHSSGKHHRFAFGEDTVIEVHLERKWNLFKPLWNTFVVSDTIRLLPTGTVRYIYHGDTLSYEARKTAQVGPGIYYIKMHQKRK